MSNVAADRVMPLPDRYATCPHEGRILEAEQAAALKNEARRRVKEGEFFGHISFMSLIARKPISC